VPSWTLPIGKPLRSPLMWLLMCCASLILLGYMGHGYYFYQRLGIKWVLVKRQQLANKFYGIRKSTGKIERYIGALRQRDDLYRLRYGMRRIGPDMRAVGIGGYENNSAQNSQAALSLIKNEIRRMLSQLEKLNRQADLQKFSFQQISKTIDDQTKKITHIPSILPTQGRITSTYGYRVHPLTRTRHFHAGIDIANRRWTPVYSAAHGFVEKADYHRRAGNYIVINHGNGFRTKLAHLRSMETKKGMFVQRGELVGYMGSSGRSTGPHLHYEISFNNRSINPKRFFEANFIYD